MTGLILLAFLALLVAFFYNRFRGKMNLRVSGRTWAGAIVVFVVLVLVLWTSSHGHLSRSGTSNHTTLPSRVGREPHRTASCSTR